MSVIRHCRRQKQLAMSVATAHYQRLMRQALSSWREVLLRRQGERQLLSALRVRNIQQQMRQAFNAWRAAVR